jgi:hypothetical protein
MRVEVGPVDAAAARQWIDHVAVNLAVVRSKPERLPFRLPTEVADAIEALLATWARVAERGGVFHWVDVLDDDEVRALVRYWTNLDALTDDQVRALGLDWAPAGARPFFNAVAGAVAAALAHAERGQDPFAARLVEHGRRPVRSVAVA